MKNKYLFLGTAVALGALVYWKFGKANKGKVVSDASDGSGSANGTITRDSAQKLDAPEIPDTAGSKPAKCGQSFTLYYGDIRHDYTWNNGKPSVTKTRQMPYPQTRPVFGAPIMMSASGYMPINIYAPVTNKITVAAFNAACVDKQSGKYNYPKTIGGAPPVDPVYPNVPVNTTIDGVQRGIPDLPLALISVKA